MKHRASQETEDLAEQISRLAYQLFERRGGADGHDVEDWLAAERLILATAAGVNSKPDRTSD